MAIEISTALIALALMILTACSLIFLMQAGKTLNSVKKDIHNVTSEGIDLMKKMEALVTDVQAKTDSLDFVFRPLKSIGKGKHKGKTTETVSEIVEWVSTSLTLFNKIKHAVKRREK